jgi:hypothetical protein
VIPTRWKARRRRVRSRIDVLMARVYDVALPSLTRLSWLQRRRTRVAKARLQDVDRSLDDRVFISYSRSETPLVEDLVDELLLLGISTFVDFRQLIPGAGWEERLNEAASQARTIVLVVSDRAVWESEPVMAELRMAMRSGRRIVLAVADRCVLPPYLVGLPCLDLRRGRFRRRVAELAEVIDGKRELGPAPAETNAARPWAVRLGVAAAAVLATMSLVFLGTVVLPAVLMPLPVRVLRRTYSYPSVRLAAFAMVPGYLALLTSLGEGGAATWAVVAVVASFLVLRSRGFGRWMTPRAVRPRLPLLRPATASGASVRFALHSAPQDVRYADQVARVLQDAGHQMVGAGVAETGGVTGGPVMVVQLVSRFNDTATLAHHTRTLPVLISDFDDELPEALQRTQWIDLRHGSPFRRHAELRQVAALLGAPARLLATVGVAPPHESRSLPRGIRFAHDTVMVLLALLYAVVFLLVSDRPVATNQLLPATGVGVDECALSAANEDNFFLGLGLVAIVGLIVMHRLRHRRTTVGFPLYLVALFGAVCLAVFAIPECRAEGPMGAANSTTGFVLIVVFVLLVLAWRETTRWISPIAEQRVRPKVEHSLRGRAIDRAAGAARAFLADVLGSSLRKDERRRRSRAVRPLAPPVSVVDLRGKAQDHVS